MNWVIIFRSLIYLSSTYSAPRAYSEHPHISTSKSIYPPHPPPSSHPYTPITTSTTPLSIQSTQWLSTTHSTKKPFLIDIYPLCINFLVSLFSTGVRSSPLLTRCICVSIVWVIEKQVPYPTPTTTPSYPSPTSTSYSHSTAPNSSTSKNSTQNPISPPTTLC